MLDRPSTTNGASTIPRKRLDAPAVASGPLTFSTRAMREPMSETRSGKTRQCQNSATKTLNMRICGRTLNAKTNIWLESVMSKGALPPPKKPKTNSVPTLDAFSTALTNSLTIIKASEKKDTFKIKKAKTMCAVKPKKTDFQGTLPLSLDRRKAVPIKKIIPNKACISINGDHGN